MPRLAALVVLFVAAVSLAVGDDLPWKTIAVPVADVAAAVGKAGSLSAAVVINQTAWNSTNDSQGAQTLIAFGRKAKAGQFPFMASLLKSSSSGLYHTCGATLIAPNLLLTSAHCCFDSQGTPESPVYALLGGTDISSVQHFKEQIAVTDCYYHRDYNFFSFSTTGADIAIIQLDTPSRQPLVQLATSDPTSDIMVTAVGWGETENSNLNNHQLLYAPLQVSIDQEPCPTLPDGVLCEAGDEVNSDAFSGAALTGTCPGDSGGPQLLQGTNVQVALTSYGPDVPCGTGSWGAYTSVAYYYTSFIEVVVGTYGVFPPDNLNNTISGGHTSSGGSLPSPSPPPGPPPHKPPSPPPPKPPKPPPHKPPSPPPPKPPKPPPPRILRAPQPKPPRPSPHKPPRLPPRKPLHKSPPRHISTTGSGHSYGDYGCPHETWMYVQKKRITSAVASQSMHVASLSLCASACANIPWCRSISYQNPRRTCLLYKQHLATLKLTPDKNFVVGRGVCGSSGR